MSKHTTVSSLSGGRTSSMIAAKYPSDYELFALVCTNDPKMAHKDKKVMQYANDKLAKYCPQWGEVIGTAENPVIFATMMDLEQYIGREIIWLRGISFDDLILQKQMIPNKLARFCTQEMKLRVIFEWCFKYLDLQPIAMQRRKNQKQQNYYCKNPVRMRIGYRGDEKHRRDTFSTTYTMPTESRIYSQDFHKTWSSNFINWRKGDFVLIDRERTNAFYACKILER